ncbi:MAG: alpha/beta hydrolase family protein [Pseudonocardiaceae bacterium]
MDAVSRISFPSGARSLVGELIEPPRDPGGGAGNSGAGLLFVHGYASDRRGYSARAVEISEHLRFTCLAFDLGGHGDSPGRLRDMTRQDHLQDVVAAYDVLASADGVDPRRVGVCAASYGAYISCLLLGERLVKRLMLRAPALYVDGDPADPDGSRNHLRELIDADSALHNLRQFNGETLILESERDEVIPRSSITAYVTNARHPTHRILEGATHALVQPELRAAFLDEILVWFRDL